VSGSHRSGGLYRVLEFSRAYEGCQRLLGGRAARDRFVREFVRPEPGARILDVGCGTGSLLDHLPADVDYVGYDPNERYLATARERYGERGRFFQARVGESLPLEASSFDLVVAKALVHHLDDDEANHLFRSARAHLRPGGALVTIDPVFHDHQSRFARALISRDRGCGVRTPEGYRCLLEAHFERLQGWLLTDQLRIPYSHYVQRALR
jgi:SAM-dependent methyltransferase